MSLEVQTIPLSQIATLCFASDKLSDTVAGHCVSMKLMPLIIEGARHGVPWLVWLLQRIVAGLWEEQLKRRAVVFYDARLEVVVEASPLMGNKLAGECVLSDVVRVFLCNKQRSRYTRLKTFLDVEPISFLSGPCRANLETLRPLIYWEPPCTMVALWPPGPQGDIDGERLVDTCTEDRYVSLSDLNEAPELKSRFMIQRFVRVPSESQTAFRLLGHRYTYENRWGIIE